MYRYRYSNTNAKKKRKVSSKVPTYHTNNIEQDQVYNVDNEEVIEVFKLYILLPNDV